MNRGCVSLFPSLGVGWASKGMSVVLMSKPRPPRSFSPGVPYPPEQRLDKDHPTPASVAQTCSPIPFCP